MASDTPSDSARAVQVPTGIRIRGRIALVNGDRGLVLVRATMRDPKGLSHRIESSDAVIRTEAGKSLVLEWPAAEDLVAVPAKRIAGSFREVSGDVLARPWRDRKASDGTRVEIDGLAVDAGESVEIYGEPSQQAFAEHSASLRDAPQSTTTSVRVRIIAAGKNARANMDEALGVMFPALARTVKPRPELRGGTVLGGLLAALGAMFALAGLMFGSFALAVDGVLGALGCFAFGLFAHESAAYPEFLGSKERTADSRGRGQNAVFIVAGCLLAFHLALACGSLWTDAHDTAFTTARAFAGITAVWIIAFAAVRAFSGLNSVISATTLLDLPPLEPDAGEGTDGFVVGVVRDPSPVKVEGQSVAVAREHDIEFGSGSDPDIVHTRFHNDETFLVETSAAIYEVSPIHAHWATTVTQSTESHKGRVLREIVPIGAKILVGGRVSYGPAGTPPRFGRRGKDEPLSFYVTRSDRDPRNELVRVKTGHWRCALGLVLLALAAGAVGLGTHSRLPPAHPSAGD